MYYQGEDFPPNETKTFKQVFVFIVHKHNKVDKMDLAGLPKYYLPKDQEYVYFYVTFYRINSQSIY